MDKQMLDFINFSSFYCKVDCKVLIDGYCVSRSWMFQHTELDVYSYITIQSLASSFMLKWLLSTCLSIVRCFAAVYFTMCCWGASYD